jgi:hypothetical protein
LEPAEGGGMTEKPDTELEHSAAVREERRRDHIQVRGVRLFLGGDLPELLDREVDKGGDRNVRQAKSEGFAGRLPLGKPAKEFFQGLRCPFEGDPARIQHGAAPKEGVGGRVSGIEAPGRAYGRNVGRRGHVPAAGPGSLRSEEHRGPTLVVPERRR